MLCSFWQSSNCWKTNLELLGKFSPILIFIADLLLPQQQNIILPYREAIILYSYIYKYLKCKMLKTSL